MIRRRRRLKFEQIESNHFELQKGKVFIKKVIVHFWQTLKRLLNKTFK